MNVPLLSNNTDAKSIGELKIILFMRLFAIVFEAQPALEKSNYHEHKPVILFSKFWMLYLVEINDRLARVYAIGDEQN